ncbi:hypothetical protein KAFR_0D02930 [Kazachstania africana CBS 2517]|uniref:COX assembly mitochondrial protein n=1 Tax=Kazachstania africana (strain ATCC 22294 / BCRC 22015 / CBS 2517 / CECT 1963 / NBRC 1671 / NRRL Y-8276) TaxID=1071382 RepID=H2AU91_KAZAF|nr:hypothetical protein KAFR_0D02930 [Kazachstania africana CBS 2517]CCF57941.1 hypothetical protein KAFR_0D02930 [Kazachstania africana CBS 2517]
MSEGVERSTDASKHRTRLPLWALSPREEQKARSNLKDYTYEQCHDYVEAMANCAREHGIKVFPACDVQRQKMKDCLLFYQLDDKYLDHQRDLIILQKIEKLESQLNKKKEGSL